MRQSISASYGSSQCTDTNVMELPTAQLPFRRTLNGPIRPESHQHSFDEGVYFSTVRQEILDFPGHVVEASVDLWYMNNSESTTPESCRLSMSPSQSIATPSSDGCYSPPYPEQLLLPPYQFLEQPQPLRSRSTSHPNWVSHGENWDHTYAGDLWGTQTYVTQSWISSSYEGYATPCVASAQPQTSSASLTPFIFQTQDQTSAPELTQTQPHPSPAAEGPIKEDSPPFSDDDSDDSVSESSYSQIEAQTSRLRTKSRIPRTRVDRWTVAVPQFPQTNVRAFLCREQGCDRTFQRPEHLRRHYKSVHCAERPFGCKIHGCTKPFSRGDNLRDHYWTHLERGGRKGQNSKYTLAQLKAMLGPREKRLVKKLRDKLIKHEKREKLKKQQVPQAAHLTYFEHSLL